MKEYLGSILSEFGLIDPRTSDSFLFPAFMGSFSDQ